MSHGGRARRSGWLAIAGLAAATGLAWAGSARRERDLQARYAADLAAEGSRQRARVEGELHDGAQQLLVAIGRELRQLRKALTGVPAGSPERPAAPDDQALARLAAIEALTGELAAELRRVRAGLMPPALRHEGLAGALPPLVAELGRRHGYAATCQIGDWPRLAAEQEEALYWLVQEAMNNVATHAQAARVSVRLVREGDRGLIEVADDGRGCEPPDLRRPPAGQTGTGLHRLWLRLRAAGGDLAIASRPGAGCRLIASLPLPPLPGSAP